MNKKWNKMSLSEKKTEAIWIAGNLFSRNKTSGSSANLSFTHKDRIYITGSWTCFGKLAEDDFSEIDLNGNVFNGQKPSKEWPMHILFYKNNKEVQSVLHVHSFYSVLWSCVCDKTQKNVVPAITPYLQMKTGDIGAVEYYKPGSEELFEAVENVMDERLGYLLGNHGQIVGGKDLMTAFYSAEELEESCHIAWEIQKKGRVGTV